MKLNLTLGLLLAAAPLYSAVWTIDDGHSAARFKVRHLMISNVTGEFSGLKGTLDLDEKDITKTKVDATIDATTINTNNAKRDAHLKTADFFDVKKHPTLKFKSKKVVKGDGEKFQIVGDLSMHGETKEVTLHADPLSATVKDPWGGTRRGLVATTKLSRKEFGLNWNKALETGGVVVGDEVDVTLELELVAPKKDAKS